MSIGNSVNSHYSRGDLISSIQAALQSPGVPIEGVTVNDDILEPTEIVAIKR